MTALLPSILKRKIVPKVWGGRALETVLGIELPPGELVGETWELYDRPDGSSPVRGTDLTVHDLLQRNRVELLGVGVEPTREGRFPLALKFLDAAQVLSVQVHPDDEQAERDGDSGKPEAWVVLHAGAGARILRGFHRGVTRESFEAVAADQRVTELLESFVPTVGDCISLPPGTVHTLGPDVVVLEIQYNSGITYRLYDWGRDRELHVEQGIEAARFGLEPETVSESSPTADGGEWLVRNSSFSMRRYTIGEPRAVATEGSFKVLTMLAGRAMVGWKSQGEHDPLQVGPAESVLIPACTDEVFVSPVGEVSAVVSGPGVAS